MWVYICLPLLKAALGSSNVGVRRALASNRKLADEWSKKCGIYLHAEQEGIHPSTVRKFRKSTCMQAGVCVCQAHNPGQGPKSWQLCARMRQRLKQLCPKVDKRSSPRRVLLEQRCLVLGFSAAQQPGDIFLHVGYINFSTWHFAGQVLQEAPELADVSPFVRAGVLHLRAETAQQTGPALDVFSDLQFIQAFLDLQSSWSLRLYEISHHDMDWLDHEHYPDTVPVRAVPDVGEFGVWRGGAELGPAQRRPRNAGQRSSGRPCRAAAGASGDGPDGPDGDDGEVPPEDGLLYEDDAEPEEEDDVAAADDVLAEQAADTGQPEDAEGWQEVAEAVQADDVEDAAPENIEAPQAAEAPRVAREDVAGGPADAAEAAAAAAPAAPHPPRAAHARDMNASQQFDLDGLGCLRYFPHTSPPKIVAVCSRPEHQPDCRISRVTVASEFATRNFRGQGRPIGRLVSWLQMQNHESYPDARRHIHNCSASFPDRQAARAFFVSLPGGRAFAERTERPARDLEQSEPEHIR